MTAATRRSTTAKRRKGPSLFVVGLAVIPIVAIVAIALASGGGGGDLTGSPTVSGNALPAFAGEAEDPAVGMPIPEVTGADFEGDEVVVSDDGTAKILLFLAHWCSHCQYEVPVVQEWVEGGNLPDGVDLYSITTSIDRTQPNYPPDEWLAGEDWNVPLIVDDGDGSVAEAYGLNAFPYWVFVNADGTVAGRLTGRLPAEAIQSVATELAEGGTS